MPLRREGGRGGGQVKGRINPELNDNDRSRSIVLVSSSAQNGLSSQGYIHIYNYHRSEESIHTNQYIGSAGSKV